MTRCAINASTLEGITSLIGAIGRQDFASRLFGFFNALLPVDHCLVFTADPTQTLHTLFIEGLDQAKHEMMRELANDYVSGGFIDDPLFLTHMAHGDNLATCGHPIVYSILPSSLPATPFRTRFYDETKITHEINVVGEVDNTRFYVTLQRANGTLFSLSEIASIEFYTSVMINAMRRHLTILDDLNRPTSNPNALSSGQRERLLGQIRSDLAGTGKLSPREADVCARIVLGYNNMAISLHLGITPNTTSTHRKRAYSKLGICSQNELFARYVDFVRPEGATVCA